MLLSIVINGQELPQYVDNSVNKYFPPIIDQYGGSCAQASSIGYVFTYARCASPSPAPTTATQPTVPPTLSPSPDSPASRFSPLPDLSIIPYHIY